MPSIRLTHVFLESPGLRAHAAHRAIDWINAGSFRRIEEQALQQSVTDDRIRFGRVKRPVNLPSTHDLRILYRFSDGVELDDENVLRHDRCSLIPDELLPHWHGDIHHWSKIAIKDQQREMALLIFEKAIGKAQFVRGDERIVPGVSYPPDSFSNERFFFAVRALKRFSFENEERTNGSPFLYLKVDSGLSEGFPQGRAKISLEIGGLSENAVLFDHFWYYPATTTLFVHDADRFQSEVLHREYAGHETISRELTAIERRFSNSIAKTRYIPLYERITLDEFSPEIDIDDGIRILARNDRFTVCGLTSTVQSLWRALTLGLKTLPAFSAEDAISSRLKSSEREWDQRVITHIGATTTVIHELLAYALGKKIFSEMSFEALLKKLGQVVSQSKEDLRSLCSKRFIESLRHFVEDTLVSIEEESPKVFTATGVYELEHFDRIGMRILYALMNGVARLSEGECFLRAKTPYFQPLSNENLELAIVEARTPVHQSSLVWPHRIGTKKINPPAEVWTDLALHHGFQVTFQGKPLELVEESEFRAEFEIRDGVDPGTAESLRDPAQIDWFELHPRVFLKGQEIDPSQSEKLSRGEVLEHSGKYYFLKNRNLPSVQFLERFWSRINLVSKGDKKTKRNGPRYYRLPKNQALEILALRAAGLPVKAQESWQELFRFYDSLSKPRDPIPVPKSIQADLKAYQNQGFSWIHDLYRLRLGGILADDMGLGKTLQSLVFLEWLREQKRLGLCLIVVPTSLTYSWKEEARKFAPQLPIEIFNPKNKMRFFEDLPSDCVVITTYSLLAEHETLFASKEFHVTIFDEAQNLKNISAKRTTAARKLNSRFKLCLTGTPLENHYDELYSLVDLAVVGALGPLPEFRKTYVTPLEVPKAHMTDLKLRTRPLILRRNKSDILKELPPKNEISLKLPFEEKQSRIYRDIALAWNEKVRDQVREYGEAKSKLFILSALLRLRQVCSDPSAIPSVEYHEEPPKVTVLKDALFEVTDAGESALVFTQFLATFHRIHRELKALGVPVFTLHGELSRQHREKALEDFQKCEKGAVLLMTLKTGGTGLNLTKASYVFHIEPWWNPSVENQATDRTHRIGQTKSVTIYRYLMSDSVEEKIEILKDRKKMRFDALFTEEESAQSKLSESVSTGTGISLADFEYLISSRK